MHLSLLLPCVLILSGLFFPQENASAQDQPPREGRKMSSQTYSAHFLTTKKPRIDGRIEEAEWRGAIVEKQFVFPWKQTNAPITEFRALHDKNFLYLSFKVWDADVFLLDKLRDEEDEVFEDRVELYFSRDDQLHDYFCIEIDPRGRIFDYRGAFYRKLDPKFRWPGVKAKASLFDSGYMIEASVPLASFEKLDFPRLSSGSKIRFGMYRAEFSHDRSGRSVEQKETLHNLGRRLDGPPPIEEWISWVDPRIQEPDFHVPATFGWLEFR